MTIQTEHCYIIRDDQVLGGEPIIKGTRTPVRAIVENWRLGVAPEEIPVHLPHVSLAQVFDALSYFSDHQEEINGYIERNRVPDELIEPLVLDQDVSVLARGHGGQGIRASSNSNRLVEIAHVGIA
jgi:uncharacterized protein (DUF433 family)